MIYRIKGYVANRSHISNDSPWFFSLNSDRVAGKNISIKSGTRRMTRNAHSVAFFRMYAFGDFIRRSTSLAKSRAISGEAIAPNVHNAKPTTNWVVLFKSLHRRQKDALVETQFNWLIFMKDSLFQTICYQQVNILAFVEQKHRAQVADSFVGETWTRR